MKDLGDRVVAASRSNALHSQRELARSCDCGPERVGLFRSKAEPVPAFTAQARFEFLEVRGESGKGRAQDGFGIEAATVREAGEREQGGTKVISPGGVVGRAGSGVAQGGEGAVEHSGEVGGG